MKTNRILRNEDVIAATLGGAVLGGGGGSRLLGETLGFKAIQLGSVELVSIDALPEDALLLTVSAVGAPAAQGAYVTAEDYVNAVRNFVKYFECTPAGIITNECGGNATVNGWIQAAALQIPLVDAPCNGRAHPTGSMGALSLQREPDYLSRQVAIGGNPDIDTYLEIAVSGSLESASRLVRNASVAAGGMVAVARNPVTVAYAKEHAALGAIEQSLTLGHQMIEASKRGDSIPRMVAQFLHGLVYMTGTIKQLTLETKNGFDVGTFNLVNDEQSVEITFWNEYMTLSLGDRRVATFPDLIMTFSVDTGFPITSAEIREETEVTIIYTDKKNLRLGSGVLDKKLYQVAEEAVGKDLISYL